MMTDERDAATPGLPDFRAFEASLQAGEPDTALSAPLLALWQGLRGNWDAAHQLAQREEDSDAAWVHAWLHRVEGDLANARYWYGLAGRPVAQGDIRLEGLAIARQLIEG